MVSVTIISNQKDTIPTTSLLIFFNSFLVHVNRIVIYWTDLGITIWHKLACGIELAILRVYVPLKKLTQLNEFRCTRHI